MKENLVEYTKVTMTEIVMPNDTNPSGNLMGGILMKWMDIATSMSAAKHSHSYVVTASVDHVSFASPIHLGDIVTLNAKVVRSFNSSMEVYVEVYAQNMKGEDLRKSNHAYFTFVALDDDRSKPIKVQPIKAVTDEDVNRYNGAIRRRELRLILSGRLNPKNAKELITYFEELES